LKSKRSSSEVQAQVCFLEDDQSMRTLISHARNPLMGWDINVNVTADATQKIAYVEVRVNDFQEVDDTPDNPLDSWDDTLTQKGVYPGANKVDVLVRDQNGKDYRAEHKW